MGTLICINQGNLRWKSGSFTKKMQQKMAGGTVLSSETDVL